MKIREIKASVHHIEVPIPLFDKPVVTRRIVHCEVETDEGITGYGLTGGQFLPHSVVAPRRVMALAPGVRRWSRPSPSLSLTPGDVRSCPWRHSSS